MTAGRAIWLITALGALICLSNRYPQYFRRHRHSGIIYPPHDYRPATRADKDQAKGDRDIIQFAKDAGMFTDVRLDGDCVIVTVGPNWYGGK
jgi:hypothetical protein